MLSGNEWRYLIPLGDKYRKHVRGGGKMGSTAAFESLKDTFVWSHLTPSNLLSSFLVFGRWFPGGRSVIPCKVIQHSTTSHSLGVTSA